MRTGGLRRRATRTAATPPIPCSACADALRGARIGFPRRGFSGDDPQVDAAMDAALDALRASGASVVEIELPPWLLRLSGELQAIIVRTEAAPSLNAYLPTSFPPGYPRRHADILALSEALNASTPAGAFPNPGRRDGYREEAAALPPTDASYLAAREQGRQFVKASMQATLARYRLDAIVYPTQTMRINRIGEPAQRNARGLFGNSRTRCASRRRRRRLRATASSIEAARYGRRSRSSGEVDPLPPRKAPV